MLQRAFSQLILQYARRYIRGIEADLKLSLWGGDVVLENLDLRLDALTKSLRLPSPLAVTKGFAKSLRIHIPWTSLTVKPVEITLKSLECTVTCGPHDARGGGDGGDSGAPSESGRWSQADELGSGGTPRASSAPPRDPVNKEVSSGGGGGSSTWAQLLMTKILANVTIRIDDFVLRYADTRENACVEFKMERLVFQSTSSEWKPQFSDLSGPWRLLRKACEIDGVSIRVGTLRSSRPSRSDLILRDSDIAIRTKAHVHYLRNPHASPVQEDSGTAAQRSATPQPSGALRSAAGVDFGGGLAPGGSDARGNSERRGSDGERAEPALSIDVDVAKNLEFTVSAGQYEMLSRMVRSFRYHSKHSPEPFPGNFERQPPLGGSDTVSVSASSVSAGSGSAASSLTSHQQPHVPPRAFPTRVPRPAGHRAKANRLATPQKPYGGASDALDSSRGGSVSPAFPVPLPVDAPPAPVERDQPPKQQGWISWALGYDDSASSPALKATRRVAPPLPAVSFCLNIRSMSLSLTRGGVSPEHAQRDGLGGVMSPAFSSRHGPGGPPFYSPSAFPTHPSFVAATNAGGSGVDTDGASSYHNAPLSGTYQSALASFGMSMPTLASGNVTPNPPFRRKTRSTSGHKTFLCFRIETLCIKARLPRKTPAARRHSSALLTVDQRRRDSYTAHSRAHAPHISPNGRTPQTPRSGAPTVGQTLVITLQCLTVIDQSGSHPIPVALAGDKSFVTASFPFVKQDDDKGAESAISKQFAAKAKDFEGDPRLFSSELGPLPSDDHSPSPQARTRLLAAPVAAAATPLPAFCVHRHREPARDGAVPPPTTTDVYFGTWAILADLKSTGFTDLLASCVEFLDAGLRPLHDPIASEAEASKSSSPDRVAKATTPAEADTDAKKEADPSPATATAAPKSTLNESEFNLAIDRLFVAVRVADINGAAEGTDRFDLNNIDSLVIQLSSLVASSSRSIDADSRRISTTKSMNIDSLAVMFRKFEPHRFGWRQIVYDPATRQKSPDLFRCERCGVHYTVRTLMREEAMDSSPDGSEPAGGAPGSLEGDDLGQDPPAPSVEHVFGSSRLTHLFVSLSMKQLQFLMMSLAAGSTLYYLARALRRRVTASEVVQMQDSIKSLRPASLGRLRTPPDVIFSSRLEGILGEVSLFGASASTRTNLERSVASLSVFQLAASVDRNTGRGPLFSGPVSLQSKHQMKPQQQQQQQQQLVSVSIVMHPDFFGLVAPESWGFTRRPIQVSELQAGSSSFTLAISPVATMFDPALPSFVSDCVDLSSSILSTLTRSRQKRKNPNKPTGQPVNLPIANSLPQGRDASRAFVSRNTREGGSMSTQEISHGDRDRDLPRRQRLFDFLCVLKAVEFRASIGRMMFCFPFEELSPTREAMVETTSLVFGLPHVDIVCAGDVRISLSHMHVFCRDSLPSFEALLSDAPRTDILSPWNVLVECSFKSGRRYASHVMPFLDTSTEFGFLEARVSAEPLRASIALYQASSVLRALRYLRDLSQSPANAPKRRQQKRIGSRTAHSHTSRRLILPLSVSVSLPEVDVRMFSSCKSARGLQTDDFFLFRCRKFGVSADANERAKPTRISLLIESMDLMRLRANSNTVQHPSHHLIRTRTILAHRCTVVDPQTKESLVYMHASTEPIDVSLNARLLSDLSQLTAAAPMLPPSAYRHRRYQSADQAQQPPPLALTEENLRRAQQQIQERGDHGVRPLDASRRAEAQPSNSSRYMWVSAAIGAISVSLPAHNTEEPMLPREALLFSVTGLNVASDLQGSSAATQSSLVGAAVACCSVVVPVTCESDRNPSVSQLHSAPSTDSVTLSARASLEGVSVSLIRWASQVRALHEIRGVEESLSFQVDSSRSLLKRPVSLSAEVTMPYRGISGGGTTGSENAALARPVNVTIRATSVHVLFELSALHSLNNVAQGARQRLAPRTKARASEDPPPEDTPEDAPTRSGSARAVSISTSLPLFEVEVVCDESGSRHLSSSLSLAVAGISVTTRSNKLQKSGTLTVANITSHFKRGGNEPVSVSNVVTWPEDSRLLSSLAEEHDAAARPVARVAWKSIFGQRSTSTIEVASINVLVPMEAVIFCRSVAQSFPKTTSSPEAKETNHPQPTKPKSYTRSSNSTKFIIAGGRLAVGHQAASAILTWSQIFALRSPRSTPIEHHDHFALSDATEINISSIALSLANESSVAPLLEPSSVDITRSLTLSFAKPKLSPSNAAEVYPSSDALPTLFPEADLLREEVSLNVFLRALSLRAEIGHVLTAKVLMSALEEATGAEESKESEHPERNDDVPHPTVSRLSLPADAVSPRSPSVVLPYGARRFYQDDLRSMKISENHGERPTSSHITFSSSGPSRSGSSPRSDPTQSNSERWMSWCYPSTRVVTHVSTGALLPALASDGEAVLALKCTLYCFDRMQSTYEEIDSFEVTVGAAETRKVRQEVSAVEWKLVWELLNPQSVSHDVLSRLPSAVELGQLVRVDSQFFPELSRRTVLSVHVPQASVTLVGRTLGNPSVEQEFCVLHAADIGARSVRTPKAGSTLKFGVGALGLNLHDYRDLTVREVAHPFRVDGYFRSQDLRRVGPLPVGLHKRAQPRECVVAVGRVRVDFTRQLALTLLNAAQSFDPRRAGEHDPVSGVKESHLAGHTTKPFSCAHYVIVNRTGIALSYGQVDCTAEHYIRPGEEHAFSWASLRSQLLWIRASESPWGTEPFSIDSSPTPYRLLQLASEDKTEVCTVSVVLELVGLSTRVMILPRVSVVNRLSLPVRVRVRPPPGDPLGFRSDRILVERHIISPSGSSYVTPWSPAPVANPKTKSQESDDDQPMVLECTFTDDTADFSRPIVERPSSSHVTADFGDVKLHSHVAADPPVNVALAAPCWNWSEIFEESMFAAGSGTKKEKPAGLVCGRTVSHQINQKRQINFWSRCTVNKATGVIEVSLDPVYRFYNASSMPVYVLFHEFGSVAADGHTPRMRPRSLSRGGLRSSPASPAAGMHNSFTFNTVGRERASAAALAAAAKSGGHGSTEFLSLTDAAIRLSGTRVAPGEQIAVGSAVSNPKNTLFVCSEKGSGIIRYRLRDFPQLTGRTLTSDVLMSRPGVSVADASVFRLVLETAETFDATRYFESAKAPDPKAAKTKKAVVNPKSPARSAKKSLKRRTSTTAGVKSKSKSATSSGSSSMKRSPDSQHGADAAQVPDPCVVVSLLPSMVVRNYTDYPFEMVALQDDAQATHASYGHSQRVEPLNFDGAMLYWSNADSFVLKFSDGAHVGSTSPISVCEAHVTELEVFAEALPLERLSVYWRIVVVVSSNDFVTMVDVLPKFVFQNRCDAPLRLAPLSPTFAQLTPKGAKSGKEEVASSIFSFDTKPFLPSSQHTAAGGKESEAKLPGELSFERGHLARLTQWSCARAVQARKRHRAAKGLISDWVCVRLTYADRSWEWSKEITIDPTRSSGRHRFLIRNAQEGYDDELVCVVLLHRAVCHVVVFRETQPPCVLSNLSDKRLYFRTAETAVHRVVDSHRITRFQVPSPKASTKASSTSSSTQVPGWENEEQISRSSQPPTIRFALRAPGYAWTEPLVLRANSDVVVSLERSTSSAMNLRGSLHGAIDSGENGVPPAVVSAPLVPKTLRVHLLTTVRRGTFVIYARTLSSIDPGPHKPAKLPTPWSITARVASLSVLLHDCDVSTLSSATAGSAAGKVAGDSSSMVEAVASFSVGSLEVQVQQHVGDWMSTKRKAHVAADSLGAPRRSPSPSFDLGESQDRRLPPEARSSFAPANDSSSPVSVTSAPSFIRRDSHPAVTRALRVSAKTFRLVDLSSSSDYRVVAQFDPDSGDVRSRRFELSCHWNLSPLDHLSVGPLTEDGSARRPPFPDLQLVSCFVTPLVVHLDHTFLLRLARSFQSLGVTAQEEYRRLPRSSNSAQEAPVSEEKELDMVRVSGVDAEFLGLVDSVLRPRLYVQSFHISEISLSLSLHANLAVFVGAQRMPLYFTPVTLTSILCAPQRLAKELTARYLADAIMRSPVLLGSLDVLGNPTFLVQSISTGLSSMISIPRDSFRSGKGTAAFVRSVGEGMASMLRHVSEGTFTSLSGITSSLARNLDQLSSQPVIEPNRPSSRTISGGVYVGMKSFGSSVFRGVTGVVTEPARGFSAGGTRGLLRGVGSGVLGFVAKPLSGALDLLSSTTQSIVHQYSPDTTQDLSPKSAERNSQERQFSLLKFRVVARSHDDVYDAHLFVRLIPSDAGHPNEAKREPAENLKGSEDALMDAQQADSTLVLCSRRVVMLHGGGAATGDEVYEVFKVADTEFRIDVRDPTRCEIFSQAAAVQVSGDARRLRVFKDLFSAKKS